MVHDPQAQEGLAISTWVNDRVAAKVNITPEEVRKFYQEHKEEFKKPETVKVAHILIRPEDESEAAKKAAQEKAGKILSRLKKGEDFGKIAAQESACPSGKQNQGSLGEFPRGAMVKEFEDVAFNLQPGQLSDVVETKFGCHLIKSETHQPPAYPELSEVAGMIKENITGQKINKELEKVLEEEKNRLAVKILL
jgi:peptidyl-prolyl cis-trans isomerase C